MREQGSASLPVFSGTPGQRQIASRVFTILQPRGRFMSPDAPIRVPLEPIVAFLEKEDVNLQSASVEAAIVANPAVFAIETVDGCSIVATTRNGHAPTGTGLRTGFSFGERFRQPMSGSDRSAQPVRERPRIDPSWASLDEMLREFGVETTTEEVSDVGQIDRVETAKKGEPANPISSQPPSASERTLTDSARRTDRSSASRSVAPPAPDPDSMPQEMAISEQDRALAELRQKAERLMELGQHAYALLDVAPTFEVALREVLATSVHLPSFGRNPKMPQLCNVALFEQVLTPAESENVSFKWWRVRNAIMHQRETVPEDEVKAAVLGLLDLTEKLRRRLTS